VFCWQLLANVFCWQEALTMGRICSWVSPLPAGKRAEVAWQPMSCAAVHRPVIQHRPQHDIPVEIELTWCCAVSCFMQVPSEVQQASVSSESLTCGITSNSLPGAVPGGEMSDEDMQTYIVQVRYILMYIQSTNLYDATHKARYRSTCTSHGTVRLDDAGKVILA
jgi:hypothetical protein